MIDFGFGLYLRRIEEEDLDDMFLWRNDARIYQWCRQNSPLHWMGHLEWFKRQAHDSRLSMFAMVDSDHVIVGVCGLTDIDLINRRAEFSLYVAPNKQRLGFALAGLKTLFLHGFLDLGLNRIWGETFDKNPAFGLFTKKLGMIKEGTRREFYYRNGSYIDAHLVSVSGAEFIRNFLLPEGASEKADTADLTSIESKKSAKKARSYRSKRREIVGARARTK